MSNDSTIDDSEVVNLAAVERDAVSTGAAADSADWDERLKGLPRVLRFALLFSHKAPHIKQRLIAEINELCPHLPLSAAWAASPDVVTGLALAKELDHRAVAQNEPNLRSLADCLRLSCLPLPRDASYFEEHRRVGKALVQAFYATSHHAGEQIRCDLERFTFGWAALPACTDLLRTDLAAAQNATIWRHTASLLSKRRPDGRLRRKRRSAGRRKRTRRPPTPSNRSPRPRRKEFMITISWWLA
jgi:ATP-dependent Lon protease